MSTLIDDIVKLVAAEWRPYRGTVDAAVYERLRCQRAPLPTPGAARRSGGPYWFCRRDVFLCIGCGRRCSLSRPKGFEAPLPIRYPRICPEMPFTLTPQEMVATLSLLTIEQMAYCLNVSRRHARNLVERGKVRRIKGSPVRVAAEDVRREMETWDI